MTKTQIIVVVLLALIALGILTVVYFIISLKPLAPMPTAISPSLTVTFGPSFTPSTTSTPVVLPATWTPFPTEVPSFTPTHPTRTDTPIGTVQPTINIPASAVVLQGVGSSKTRIFHLPDNTVTINWTYYGVPGEGNQLNYAYNTYQNTVDYEKRTYQIWYDYYQRLIQNALMRNDAFGLLDAKQSLDQYTQRYNQNLASAKAKYDSQVAAYASPFKATLYRSSTGMIKTILNVKALYEGSFTLKTLDGSDYYLVVETPGQWSIRILP